MTRQTVLFAAAVSMALGSAASANEAFYSVGPRAPTEWVGVSPARNDQTVSTTSSIVVGARTAGADRRSEPRKLELPR